MGPCHPLYCLEATYTTPGLTRAACRTSSVHAHPERSGLNAFQEREALVLRCVNTSFSSEGQSSHATENIKPHRLGVSCKSGDVCIKANKKHSTRSSYLFRKKTTTLRIKMTHKRMKLKPITFGKTAKEKFCQGTARVRSRPNARSRDVCTTKLASGRGSSAPRAGPGPLRPLSRPGCSCHGSGTSRSPLPPRRRHRTCRSEQGADRKGARVSPVSVSRTSVSRA